LKFDEGLGGDGAASASARVGQVPCPQCLTIRTCPLVFATEEILASEKAVRFLFGK
jgi:disulfide bond formation protein DsbB